METVHAPAAAADDRFEKRRFDLDVDGRRVPGLAWLPRDARRRPLVLVGHGGSGHKDSQLVRDVAGRLVGDHDFVVAAIDGPVHGDRRAVFADGPAVRGEFRDLWARGGSIAPMVADWRAAIDHLSTWPEIDADAIGWYGISMGTAYGLPLVAAEPRIRAAVLGMWGTCRAGSEQLATDAPKITVPTLFQRKADDEFFTVGGQEALYDALGGPDKRLAVHPGGHTDPAGAQLDELVAFLVEKLTR